jgi:hypothetical protein
MTTGDQKKTIDKELRLATARSLPAGEALDAETASLREAFLALGSAVESAAGPTDEAAIVARLRRSSIRPAPQPTTVRDAWPLVLAGALAASALVAVGRIALESGPIETVAQVAAPGVLPLSNGSASNRAMTAAWSDSLDTEIAYAAARIEQLSTRQQSFDSSLIDMNVRLEALSQELSSESL